MLICSIVIMASTSVMAFNVNLDPQGAFMTTKSTDNHFAYGGLLGFSINDNFNIVANVLFTSGSYYISSFKMETKHTYYMGGLEYIIPGELIPWLSRNRLSLKASALTGYAESKAVSSANPLQIIGPPLYFYLPPNVTGTGIPLMIKGGIMFDITQHFALYFDMGYHVIFSNATRARTGYTAYQDKFITGDVQGLIINVGIRFSFLKRQRLY